MEFLACLAYLAVGRQRKMVLRNLATAFPGLSETDRRLIARRMYRNLGRNAAEFVVFGKLSESNKIDDIVEVVGKTHLDKAYAEGRGVLLLTAHLGNWELLGGWLVKMGYRLTALARKVSYRRYEDVLESLRKDSGFESIDRDNTREILRRIKKGHLIAILSDQDIPKLDGVYVSFLGTLAYTPTGIVLLALKTGAPIVPMFIIRQTGGRHRIAFRRPLELVRTGQRSWDILLNTIGYTNVIEEMVRAYPEQWMWFHNRWRKQPEWVFLRGPGTG
jgi:KDO2-lipid IV(A) lauroyltransferase